MQYICVSKGKDVKALSLSLFCRRFLGEKRSDFRKIPSDLVKIFSDLIFLPSDFRNATSDSRTTNLKLS